MMEFFQKVLFLVRLAGNVVRSVYVKIMSYFTVHCISKKHPTCLLIWVV